MASRSRRSASKSKKVRDRSPGFDGWNTTDEDELERRRWRGLTETVSIEDLEPDFSHFGTFGVCSTSGSMYDVEIRSLTARENSCGCPDWRVNGLGTCKHIEGVIEQLRRRGKRAFTQAGLAGSPRIEVFPAMDGSCAVQVRRAGNDSQTCASIARYCNEDGFLAGDPLTSLAALRHELHDLGPGAARFSRHLDSRMDEERRRRARADDRRRFLAEIKAGTATFEFLRHPMLPYQVEGMLHLAFGERALLADEMGLGKTVQAIAACELLRRLRGVQRVLVVLPASLKAEWEDQIARFTDLSVTVVSGARPARLRLYAAATFFILVNYEQVLSDCEDINTIVHADIVILDEAQRIKNWQTKTARAVKGLRSPYAFVLTGTPLENRIDEVYSIVQYLDPRLLGPLFRFNRDFYVLDQRGRPTDYKNLASLRERLAPIMLRRRKDEVGDQIPDRTIDTFYVAMTKEQRLRYADYEMPASRLIAQAQRRPLRKEEFDRLQQLLACMRMICDTPYILDPNCRVSPKLDELESILVELLSEPDRKIIIFSEWERMLELVRELAQELGVEPAWHTGSVPQDKRRVEIRRFKNDPTCRLFLSTDCGSVGLNLQAASAVINMDLPWNPARLEQRIARAWRKYQTKAVTVINLVCEDSIEHRIQHILVQKQGVADGVLDGRGDIDALKMPSGRAAMVERMAGLLQNPAHPPATPHNDPVHQIALDIVGRLDVSVLSIESYRSEAGAQTLLVVMTGTPGELEAEHHRLAEPTRQAGVASVQIVEHSAWLAMNRLAAAGLIRLSEPGEMLYRSASLNPGAGTQDKPLQSRNQKAALEWLKQAERTLRMATLLADGGFPDEASQPLSDAAGRAIRSLAILVDPELDAESAEAMPDIELSGRASVRAHLPPGSIADLGLFADLSQGGLDIAVRNAAAQRLLATARAVAERSRAA